DILERGEARAVRFDDFVNLLLEGVHRVLSSSLCVGEYRAIAFAAFRIKLSLFFYVHTMSERELAFTGTSMYVEYVLIFNSVHSLQRRCVVERDEARRRIEFH